MKILFVNYVFGTTARGLNFELSIIKELQKMGHEITMVTSDIGPFFEDKNREQTLDITQQSFDQFDKITEIYGIPVFIVHCSSQKMGMYCPDAKQLAKKIVKNYDIVHIHSWYNHLALVFSRVSYEYEIPFVFTAYASLQSGARKYKKRIKWLVNELYTKKMIQHASALHSLGEIETEEFIKLGGDPKKIYRIDFGLNLDNFRIDKRTDILDRLGLEKSKKPYILFLGRIDRKKGIELLLHAFAKLEHKNLVLVIAGTGTKSYEQKIRQLVWELKIDKSVIFAGLILGNEKLELLESAKILLLTSWSDVHPVAVQEALAMGVPVLVTKTCDFREVDEYKAGITVEPDVNSVYQALIEMLTNNGKLELFSKNAKRLIKERFLMEGKAEKYEQMYIDVAKSNARLNRVS